MPGPLTTSLLVFGAILTTVSPVAGVVVAGLALLLQIVVFILAASDS